VTALGLWNIAEQEPTRGRCRPGGRTVSTASWPRGQPHGGGLRAMGCARGRHRLMMPNCAELLACISPPCRPGCNIVAVTGTWSARGRYILSDRGANRSWRTSASPKVAATAATGRAGAGARFAVGEVPGFRALPRWGPTSRRPPDERTMGGPMLYTSGTTGDPRVSAAAHRRRPGHVPGTAIWFFGIWIAPHHNHVHLCGSRSTPPGAQLRDHLIQLGHPAV